MKKIVQIFFILLVVSFQGHAQLAGVNSSAASDISFDGAKLNGVITGSGSVDYQFNYGTVEASLDQSTTLETINLTLPNTTVSADINLAAETQYYFELFADDGTVSFSSNPIRSFYTLSTIFPTAIVDFTAGTATNETIQLNWDASNSTTTDGYLILFAEGATPPNPTDPSVNIQKGVLPGMQTFTNKVVVASDAIITTTVPDLNPGTQYSFTIIPYNNDGFDTPETTNYNLTAYSSVSAFTLANEPTSDPTGQAVANRAVDEITISYDPVNSGDGYLVLWKEGAVAPTATEVVDGIKSTDGSEFTDADGYEYIQGSASTTPAISLPSEGTEYSFRIIPFSHASDEPATYNYRTPGVELLSGFTFSALPETKITGINKIGATTTSIDLDFDDYTFPPGGDGFFVTYYQEGSSEPDISALTNGVQPINQTTLSLDYNVENDESISQITANKNLTAGKQYAFKIVPGNLKTGDFPTIHYRPSDAETNTFWTLATQPDANPGAASVVSISDNSITISYGEVATADGYLILYRANNNAPNATGVQDGVIHVDASDFDQATGFHYAEGTSNTEVEITNLDPADVYSFRILPYAYAVDGSMNPVEETYNYRLGGVTLVEKSTAATIPAEAVSNFEAISRESDRIEFQWDDYDADPGFTNNGGFLLYYEPYTNADPIDLSTIQNGVAPGSQTGLVAFEEITTDNETSTTISGLSAGVRYKFTIIPYNRDGGDNATIAYNIAGKPNLDYYTLAVPADGGADAANFSSPDETFESVDLSWDAVTDANGYLIVYEEGTTDLDLSTLLDGFAPGDLVSPGFSYQEVSTSATLPVTISGLNALTNYAFHVIPFTNNGGVSETYNYNKNNPLLVTATTSCEPPSTTASFTAATDITAGSVTLNWTSVPDAQSYLIVAKQGSVVDLDVNNGDDFTGDVDSDFTTADIISNDNKIVFAGAETTETITGLAAGLDYTFEIYAYKDVTFCYAFGPEEQTITTLSVSDNNSLSLNTPSAEPFINSVGNDQNNSYVTVMDFNMTDGGVDGIATKLASFAFSPGTGNDFVDWSALIQDAKVVNVSNSEEVAASSITASEIAFSVPANSSNGAGDFGYIEDNTSDKMQLQIRLKSSIALTQIDGLNFVFELNPSTISTQGNSSEFNTTAGTEITTVATDNEIVVEATQFEFKTSPSSPAIAGVNVTPQAVVEAKDANGNLDFDYTTNFTVSSAISMQNLPTTFSNGTMQFPADFNYQGSGIGTLTIEDNTDNFSAQSSLVTVNPSVELAELTAGVNAGTLQSGTTDQAVLGFEIEALGDTQINEIEFTTDADLTGLVNNLRIVLSPDNTYDGTESSIASSPTIVGGNTITFSGLSQDFSSEIRHYFLIVDVEESVNLATPPLTFELNIDDIIFTNSANKVTNSFSSEAYSFEDITKPVVDQVTATPTVLSGADAGAGAIAIEITFNEEMDPTAIPQISFPNEAPGASLSGPDGTGAWTSANTVYTLYYTLSDQDVLIENIDVLITTAKDKAGNELNGYTEIDLFTIDTENPKATNIELGNSLINPIDRPDKTLELELTFDKVMNTTIHPSFTFNGTTEFSSNGDGAWNPGGQVYTVTFDHSLAEEEVVNASVSISTAEDEVGNEMDPATSGDFNINTIRPRIDNITSTNLEGIYKAADVIEIQVEFDEDVIVSGNPILELNTGAQAVYVNTSNSILTFEYTVAAGENISLLDVTQFDLNSADITNSVGNEAIVTLPGSANRLQDNVELQIDTRKPEVQSANVDIGVISQGNPAFNLEIVYDENMSQSSTPSFAFSAGNNVVFQNGEWLNATTYRAQFLHDLDPEELEDVLIEISGATDFVGNVQVAGDSETFDIDTQSPSLTVNPFTPQNGELNVSQSLTFTIEMNEPVSGQGNSNITILERETGNVLVVLDAGDAFTNSASNTLEFDSFENSLVDSTEYYIVFDPGALVDPAGNEFAGFTADNIWSFTTFGPARIDNFSVGACVGATFTIEGQYFTGVSRIRTNIDGDTPFTISTFTIVDDENIEFILPTGTVPGNITLDKQNGQAGNTESASTTSDEEIMVGPSSAQMVFVDPSNSEVCDVNDLGNENEVELTVDIVGGSGTYTLVYQVNDEDPVTITGYVEGQTFSIVPPDSADNNVRVISLTDEDEILEICSAPDVGSDLEIIKFIRSKVDAGGFNPENSEIGVIELCAGDGSIVDFSNKSLVTIRPSITGDVEAGIWTIQDGPSSNAGGFSPDFTLKSVQTDRPDTVKYYASFGDGVRGEITLELTSDDPGGLNPCEGTSDLVIIRFVETIAVNTDRNVSICKEEDENGDQIALAYLSSVVSGGSAADSLGIEWTRVDEFNEEADYDETWGFKDDEDQVNYKLTSNVLNPIYKASPQEMLADRSTLEVAPFVFSGVGCGTVPGPKEINVTINDVPTPTVSLIPQIVCSDEEEVRFRMNPSNPNNTFLWSLTNVGADSITVDSDTLNTKNQFDGTTNSNLIFVNFRSVDTVRVDTLVVQEFNPSTGCFSKPDTFHITLRPQPIAVIDYRETTTISRSSRLIPLIGLGGSDSTKLKGDTSLIGEENFQFFGPGVIRNSDSTYFLDASQLGLTDLSNEEDDHEIFFTYTNEFGCTATTSILFDVYDADRIFRQLNQEQYCEVNEPITISVDPAILSDGVEVSNISGPGISDLAFTTIVVNEDTIQNLTAVFNPEAAYNDNPNEDQSLISISYSTREIENPEIEQINVAEQTVIVNPLPTLTIDVIESSFCTYDENLEFEPENITGNNFSFRLINEGLPDSLMLGDSLDGFELDFKPLDKYLNDNQQDSIRIFVEYFYKDENSCANSKIYDFIVWRQPSKPIVNKIDLCFVDGIMDIAKVETPENMLDASANKRLSWYSNLDFTADPVGEGPAFQPPANFFTTENERRFYVVRRNTDSEGEAEAPCESAYTEVIFRKIANPDFQWNASTFGEQNIIFTGIPKQIDFESAQWTFTNISGETEIGVPADAITKVNDTTVTVDFSGYGAGRYRVNFTAFTKNSCSANVSKEIIVLPRTTSENRYDFNFNNSKEGWVSSGFKRSEGDTVNRHWDFAIPSGASTFESEQPVWITNSEGSYESNIVSYVYSPSMDIRNIERPVVSFDLWTNISEGDDGMILEYSTDGKIIEDDDKRWKVLGTYSDGASSGLGWYDTEDIESRPGTNFINESGESVSNNFSGIGWSFENDAESIGAINAKHALEEIPMEDRDSLIFRFQFKSTSSESDFGNRDGAAFDNFSIESLNRNVLIEYFGDSESSSDATEMEELNSEFMQKGNFAWINYRVNEEDPLYKQQASAMLSRVYYYDAYELGDQFALDGVINTEFTFDEVGSTVLSRARLFTSISNIDLDVSLLNPSELAIDVSFESVENLGDDVSLYVAVLQKEVTGDITYYNVLRQLLPGNTGIEVTGTSGQHSVNFKATRPSDEAPLAVVAFLQNTETGKVLQSAYKDGLPELTMATVTSIEEELAALNIKLFPNPAHDNLNINWDSHLQEEVKARVIDLTGKTIKEFRLERGALNYELNTSSLKTGMYNLILTNQKGEYKMMKFAVTN